MDFQKITKFIRGIYETNEKIPLHSPTFNYEEKNYVVKTIESSFVSSVGSYVDQFEQDLQKYTKCGSAVVTVNGTSALTTALIVAGIKQNDLVITQPLTFVATCNALFHIGARPIFVDVSKNNLGLSATAVRNYLESFAYIKDSKCCHRKTNQQIKALMPMHTFGHPAEMDELSDICDEWNLTLIEDAAESLGSYYKGRHTGTIGTFGALSFNGNKIITTGGGGAVLCKTEALGKKAKHISTTAKVDHAYEFLHDEIGYNFRMPNINAALGCAQIKKIDTFIQNKRSLAIHYEDFFRNSEFKFVKEPEYAKSNYWLNAVICPTVESKNEILKGCNSKGIMVRPAWRLMHKLDMFKNELKGELPNSEYFENLLINLPSTPTIKAGLK